MIYFSEFRKMNERKVWRKTMRQGIVPQGRRCAKRRWVFEIKRNGIFRCRLVTCGYSQIPGVDFTEIISPGINDMTWRVLIILKIAINLQVLIIDIEKTFLYGDFEVGERIFVHRPSRKVTYGSLVASIRPTKEETHRVRVTVGGGDRLNYPGVTTTHCASLGTTKCLLNSTLSTPDAKFMVLDNNCYGTPMARFEYMRLPIALILEEIVAQYKLLDLVHKGFVYLEICKGTPGLKQAGKIANDCLTKHLPTFSYPPVARTPSLWKHATLPIMFLLVVNDFGVKYNITAAANHLIPALQQMYKIAVNWEGALYLGLPLRWNYVKRTVNLSIPGYIDDALHQFQQSAPSRPQDAPTPGQNPPTGPRSSMPTRTTTPHASQLQSSLSSKKSSARCCTMCSLSIPPCSSPWDPSPLHKPKPHTPPTKSPSGP
jgi:hypothetical protein